MNINAYSETRNAFAARRQRERENALADDQRTLARSAGQLLSAGDTTGARNALWNGGQLDAGYKVDENTDEARKRKAEATARFATGVARSAQEAIRRGMPEDQAYAAAWQAGETYAPHLGIDPEAVKGLKPHYQADPRGALAALTEQAKRELQFFQTDRGIYVGDKGTGEVSQAAKFPGRPIELDPEKNYYMADDGEGAPAVAGGPAPASGFDAHVGPLLQREGGYVAKDGRSGAPANYGINQKYNPDVDVRNISPADAKAIYKQRYWDAIGGDQLPPEAQGAVFDAAVNQGPQRALQWWQQSGGDVAKFNELRLQHYRSRPDYAKNGPTWERRVQETGGGSAPAQGGVPGFRQIQVGQPKGPDWQDLPGGGQINTRTGEKKNVPGGPGSRKDFAQLRKEFNQLDEVKNFKDVRSSYLQVRALAGKANPTPADDTALTFSFMKMLDPGSVVREGEFALVGRSAGLPDQIVMQLARVDQGKGLTPTIRARLVETAAQVLLQRRSTYDVQAETYRSIAQDMGANPDQLVEDPTAWKKRIKPAATPAKATPSPAKRPPLSSIF